MATVTLKYDARNATIRKAIDFLLSIGASVVEEKKNVRTKKSGMDEALDDIAAGRVERYESVDDFFKKNDLL